MRFSPLPIFLSPAACSSARRRRTSSARSCARWRPSRRANGLCWRAGWETATSGDKRPTLAEIGTEPPHRHFHSARLVPLLLRILGGAVRSRRCTTGCCSGTRARRRSAGWRRKEAGPRPCAWRRWTAWSRSWNAPGAFAGTIAAGRRHPLPRPRPQATRPPLRRTISSRPGRWRGLRSRRAFSRSGRRRAKSRRHR